MSTKIKGVTKKNPLKKEPNRRIRTGQVAASVADLTAPAIWAAEAIINSANHKNQKLWQKTQEDKTETVPAKLNDILPAKEIMRMNAVAAKHPMIEAGPI